ncbi:glycosyltransferase family 2 protein [Candidatus Pacearchaeota archaeon]|nr:glycosyltransferase family 2 protein [Candidatus Pacearchaeota archaeon]
MNRIIVTIPAYNEQKTIARIITDIKEVMDREKHNYKILVIDDGSRDKTAFLAKNAGAIVYSHPRNYGLAETFRSEIEKCLELKADIIVHTDADGQYLAEDIPRLIEEVRKGNHLVLGSRFKGKIESMPLVKRFGNLAFSKVISQITRISISDAQTGFRAFTKDVAKKIRITSTHTYTQEQILRASKQKFRIKEVPVYFAKRHGKSRLLKNPFEYAIKAWINILRIYRDYEPLKFFGLFGFVFFAFGFLLGLYVVYIFIKTGIVGRIPTVMLSVLLMSIGIQIWLFGFFADMNKK